MLKLAAAILALTTATTHAAEPTPADYVAAAADGLLYCVQVAIHAEEGAPRVPVEVINAGVEACAKQRDILCGVMDRYELNEAQRKGIIQIVVKTMLDAWLVQPGSKVDPNERAL